MALGWDAGWDAAFAPHAAQGLEPARVLIEFNHLYASMTADGECRLEHAGRVRHRAMARSELAAVGDWVAVRRAPGSRTGTIEAVLPRRSRFSRKVAGDLTEEQVVAANLDVVFLVMGLDGDYNLRRLERYLLMAYESGARPVVLLTKADLSDDLEARLAEVRVVAPGCAVHAVSVIDRRGLEEVASYLPPGRTGALLGSSGAGKSTLINALLGEARLRTAEVRESDSRGRHTTRHRQLIALPGHGLLIDTPGMRELQLWATGEAAQDTFEDIAALSSGCHFGNCRHRAEPRCAVVAAVADGRLAAARLESFRALQDESEALDARRDDRAQIDERRRNRLPQKGTRTSYKVRGR